MADTDNNQPKTRGRVPIAKGAYDPDSPYLAAVPSEDRPILKQLHEDFDYNYEQWQDIRAAADEDMCYVVGDPWTSEDRAARRGRPVLSLDQLGQYINQLVNTIRQNKRAVKVTPEGAGANDKTANFFANRVRQIEYRSHAQEAYTAAFENAAQRSYGYVRLTAEFESPRSRNKRLAVCAIPNPDQVLPDANGQSTSGRDWKNLFYTYTMTRAEFTSRFPTAKVQDFGPDLEAMAPRWLQGGMIQVAEYWRVTMVPRRVLEIQPPVPMLEKLKARLSGQPVQPPPTVVWIEGVDDTPKPAGTVTDSWTRPLPEVAQYLTNGVELLAEPGKPKKTVWPGPYIPFAACLGKVLYLNDTGMAGKKVILSYIRMARDSQKMYNWAKSTEAEVLAMQPRTPYMAYKGQLDADQLALIQQSLHEPVAVILANPTTETTGEQVMPLPRREIPEVGASIQGYEIAAESYRKDIQSALGAYNASIGKHDTNAKSGIAIKQLDQQSEQGSYHFIDHYDDMIAFVGEQLVTLIPHYDDTAKHVTTRKADDSTEQVRVNDPNYTGDNGEKAIMLAEAGEHAVTIATGPSFDSEREQANDLAMTLLGNPQAFPLVAGDAVRLMNVGPLGDQMAEDLDALQPPALQQKKAQQKGPNDPTVLKQMVQKLQQQLDEAHKLIAQASDEIKQQTGKVQTEYAGKMALAKLDQRKDVALQAMKDATAFAVAKINAAAKVGGNDGSEAALELIALAHEAQMTEIQNQHEKDLQASDQAHEQTMQAADHDAAAQSQASDQVAQAAQAAQEPAEPAAAS